MTAPAAAECHGGRQAGMLGWEAANSNNSSSVISCCEAGAEACAGGRGMGVAGCDSASASSSSSVISCCDAGTEAAARGRGMGAGGRLMTCCLRLGTRLGLMVTVARGGSAAASTCVVRGCQGGALTCHAYGGADC